MTSSKNCTQLLTTPFYGTASRNLSLGVFYIAPSVRFRNHKMEVTNFSQQNHFLMFLKLTLLTIWITLFYRWVGRSGVDRASSSDARGSGFEPRPLHLKKIPLLYPEALEAPRSRRTPGSLNWVKGRGQTKKDPNTILVEGTFIEIWKITEESDVSI